MEHPLLLFYDLVGCWFCFFFIFFFFFVFFFLFVFLTNNYAQYWPIISMLCVSKKLLNSANKSQCTFRQIIGYIPFVIRLTSSTHRKKSMLTMRSCQQYQFYTPSVDVLNIRFAFLFSFFSFFFFFFLKIKSWELSFDPPL